MYRSRFAFALAMAALAAILVPSSLTAQITFQRTYGGPDVEEGLSVQQTSDGGYVAAGYTWSFGAGESDVYLVKTDSRGEPVWTKTFGGALVDYGYSVARTNDGGYVVAGRTDLPSPEGTHVYLIKTDSIGDTVWTRTLGGTNYGEGQSVQQTADNGYIITGWAMSSDTGLPDVYLIKTDASGDTLWTRTFGGSDRDKGLSVQQTSDSGYIVAGYTRSFGAGLSDAYLIKTDAHGDTLWTRTYGGDSTDYAYSVQQTFDGGYVVAGYTESFGAGGRDVYIIKADAHGDTLWTRTVGGIGWDEGYSVQQTADSGFVIAGSTDSHGAGALDSYLIMTDSHGDTLWTKTFGTTGDDWGQSSELTTDCGFIIAGTTDGYGGREDVYLIKTDSLGEVAVAEPKTSPVRAPALSLTCEPNPSSGAITVRLSPFALRHSPPTLKVFDSQGRLVVSQPVQTSSFPLSTSDLPSGAYFIRCDAPGQHVTARLILQR